MRPAAPLAVTALLLARAGLIRLESVSPQFTEAPPGENDAGERPKE